MTEAQDPREPQLLGALTLLGRQVGFAVDAPRVQWAVRQHRALQSAHALLHAVSRDLGLHMAMVLAAPDVARLPLLCQHPTLGWGVVSEKTPHDTWMFSTQAGTRDAPERHEVREADLAVCVVLRAPPSAMSGPGFKGTFARLVARAMWSRKGLLIEAALATLFINLLNLGASFYSMQVYDRVIPAHALETLQVLSVGLGLTVLIELAMKKARGVLSERMATNIDASLSRQVFERLTAVRLDQFPGSVGSLASQVRGYEQVRAFFAASSLFTLVDLPFAVFFIALMGLLGGTWMMAVPLSACAVASVAALIARRRMDRLATVNAAASNRKTGLLVETVEGAETWKSAFGGWKFLARWLQVSEMSIVNELQSRQVHEHLSYLVGALHQISYGGVVAVGAWLASDGQITMGAVIACSILSGRVLTPLMAMPNLLMQMSTARAALDGIERIYALARDNEGVDRPMTPSQLRGGYQLNEASFAYAGGPAALSVDTLQIQPGERIGVLGPIGSGKSTFVKLLSGMYAPTQGQVLIDGLDIRQVSRQVLSRQIAYLAQDHRLFEGTLRDNLLLGLSEPSEDDLRRALERSGLMRLVAAHPQGLELPIFEGGRGLSGGQKQLLAFTRMLLAEPSVYLLDEPTASMDGAQEQQCLTVLNEELQQHPDRTLIVVTHKPSLLPMVNRLIVIANHRIVLSGPRDLVLAQLAGTTSTAQPAQPVVAAPSAQAIADDAAPGAQTPPPLVAATNRAATAETPEPCATADACAALA